MPMEFTEMSKPEADSIEQTLWEILSTLYNSGWIEGSNYKENNLEGSKVPSERELRKVSKTIGLLQDIIVKERIDELDLIQRHMGDCYDGHNDLFNKRIASLQSKLKETK